MSFQSAKTSGASRRYALLLFDLDGTLIDSAPDLTTALGLALGDFGLPAHDLAAVRRMVGEGQRILVTRALSALGQIPGAKAPAADALSEVPSSASQDELIDRVLARFRHHYDAHLVDSTAVYPGVAETLRALPPSIIQAVATNKPGAWARRITGALGLGSTLRWVLGEDDVGRRKPDPKLLLTLCEQAGVAPQQTLLVGDSRIDREAARAAGTAFAFCPYGYADAETLAEIRASRALTDPSAAPLGSYARPYFLENFAELLALIDG